jgi:uncharacterized membrane protein
MNDAPPSLFRIVWRWLLAAAYLAAGVLHLVRAEPFIAITPGWVPMIPAVIALTGLAEIAGAIALVQPGRRLRRAGAIGLALYAVCVFPANINHMLIDMAQAQPDLGWGYHAPRMVLQPILVWLALWVGGVIDWPFRPTLPKVG